MVNMQGSVLVLDFLNFFGIFEVMICVDFCLLEEKGLLICFYGGVVCVGSDLIDVENQEVVFEDCYQFVSDFKKCIVYVVVVMICEGMMVIFDSGSIIFFIVEVLVWMINIIVIINSLFVVFILVENKDIILVVCGGIVWYKMYLMYGMIVECLL